MRTRKFTGRWESDCGPRWDILHGIEDKVTSNIPAGSRTVVFAININGFLRLRCYERTGFVGTDQAAAFDASGRIRAIGIDRRPNTGQLMPEMPRARKHHR